jgi:uncharacterized protein
MEASFGRDLSLSGLWDEAPEPVAVHVLAHGANNDMHHPFFEGVTQALVAAGTSVLRFNFPYAASGRRHPDRPALLMQAWREALGAAVARASGLPVVAGGKSLGGRMASMVAAEDGEGFAGHALVFLGYPLHAPGKPDQPRDAHLPSVHVPMLFVQGTSDSLARFDLVQDLVRRLQPLARLHAIEGGDHSFRVRGIRRTPLEIGRELGDVAASFVTEVIS